ncbi:MAG: DUF5655 domain-containing protein [Acidimicrobiales bacterium]
MSVDEFFETGPQFERPVFEAVLAHMQSLDEDIWHEPVSVGIFFKRRTSFLQLRTMTKWVAVGFRLDRKLTSSRLSRKVVHHGGRYWHVVNVASPDAVDSELREWFTEAWELDA